MEYWLMAALCVAATGVYLWSRIIQESRREEDFQQMAGRVAAELDEHFTYIIPHVRRGKRCVFAKVEILPRKKHLERKRFQILVTVYLSSPEDYETVFRVTREFDRDLGNERGSWKYPRVFNITKGESYVVNG